MKANFIKKQNLGVYTFWHVWEGINVDKENSCFEILKNPSTYKKIGGIVWLKNTHLKQTRWGSCLLNLFKLENNLKSEEWSGNFGFKFGSACKNLNSLI